MVYENAHLLTQNVEDLLVLQGCAFQQQVSEHHSRRECMHPNCLAAPFSSQATHQMSNACEHAEIQLLQT